MDFPLIYCFPGRLEEANAEKLGRPLKKLREKLEHEKKTLLTEQPIDAEENASSLTGNQ